MTLTTTKPPLSKPDRAKRMDANFRRCETHSGAARENRKMYLAIDAFAKDNIDARSTDEGAQMLEYVTKCARALKLCSCKALYSQPTAGGSAKFIMAHTCKHKVCNVCNWWRAKQMQRKWFNFFHSEEKAVTIKPRYFPHMGITARAASVDVSGAEIFERMDFMHLVLTVPHTAEDGWQGKYFYAAEIIEKFNLMRKQDWWLDLVFAGEYTVEVSKNDSGLHIHLHVLLLVPRHITRSRNILSHEILKAWNVLTADRSKPKELLAPERMDAIRKGYKFLPEDDLNNLLLDLNATGATMISLKSLFVEVQYKQYSRARSAQRFAQNGKYYMYCTSDNKASMISGIMECLKYHFKPCSFEDGHGGYDMALLTDVLPNIFRKPLYRKFGAFHGVKCLNISENVAQQESDEIAEVLADVGAEAFHPDTLEDMAPGETTYMIVPMYKVGFNKGKRRMYVHRSKATEIIPEQYSSGTSSAIWYYMQYMIERRHGYFLEKSE